MPFPLRGKVQLRSFQQRVERVKKCGRLRGHNGTKFPGIVWRFGVSSYS